MLQFDAAAAAARPGHPISLKSHELGRVPRVNRSLHRGRTGSPRADLTPWNRITGSRRCAAPRAGAAWSAAIQARRRFRGRGPRCARAHAHPCASAGGGSGGVANAVVATAPVIDLLARATMTLRPP